MSGERVHVGVDSVSDILLLLVNILSLLKGSFNDKVLNTLTQKGFPFLCAC